MILWIDFSESHFGSSKLFSQFWVLCSSAIDLGPYECKGYTSVVLGYSEVTLLREGGMHPFVHLSIVFWLLQHNSVGAVCRRVPWCSILLGIFYQALLLFYLFPGSSHIDTFIWIHYITLTKRIEKKLDSNYTRMLRAILNKSWRQHSSKQQLYSHLPPITEIILVRRTSQTCGTLLEK